MEENKYRKAKDRAYNFYRSIDCVSCAALSGEKVYFDDRGFRHLVFKGNKRRPISEQVYRFNLMKIVPTAISKSSDITYYEGETAKFWSIKYKKIKVVVRQLRGGRKHFFSVM